MNEQELAALATQHGVTVEALVAALQAVAPKSQPTVVSHDQDQDFWLIKEGYFETTIPKRDAPTKELALDMCTNTLQPWYFVGPEHDLPNEIKSITYSQWCDWVRS